MKDRDDKSVLPPRAAAWRGRGATGNPANRFEGLTREIFDDVQIPEDELFPKPTTEFLKDASRSIVSKNSSPDVGFEASVNPYRGCEHGCAYCYARPTHEYLGFSAGLDFETKILVKEDAPALLRAALSSKGWQPKPIFLSGVTDCYQPVERRLGLTRRCLEVLAEFRNPVSIVTKNALVTRDADLLGELASHQASAVFLSVTTLDDELCGILEPRTSRPQARLRAIRALADAGVPVGVNVAPVIPGVTDSEMPAILQAAAEAGARWAGYVPVRLPYGLAPLFEAWLETHMPERKEKVLNRIRDMRGGRLNDPDFGSRMRGQGVFAKQIDAFFRLGCRRHGLVPDFPALSIAAFRRPDEQMSLF